MYLYHIPLSLPIKTLKNPAVLSSNPYKADELHIPRVARDTLLNTRFWIQQEDVTSSVFIHHVGNLIFGPRGGISGPPAVRELDLLSGDPVCHKDIIHQ